MLTACVYSDRRPDTVKDLILPALECSPIVDEIIVLHAREPFEYEGWARRRCAVTHLDGVRPWSAWARAKNDAVLSLGDGVFCWGESVAAMYEAYCKDTAVAYSPLAASFDARKRLFPCAGDGAAPLVDLRCMMFHKRLADACLEADASGLSPGTRDEESIFASLVAVKQSGRLNRSLKLAVLPLVNMTGESPADASAAEKRAQSASAFLRRASDELGSAPLADRRAPRKPALRRRLKSAVLAASATLRRVTDARRMSPSFMVLGVMRGGTTSLFRYLCQHPRVAPPDTKEIMHYAFSFALGEPVYPSQAPGAYADYAARRRAYEKHFPLMRRRYRDAMTGEASPQYFYAPEAPARIRAAHAGMKFIILLRNPVDRAWSLYHLFRCGDIMRESDDRETGVDFEAALERERRHAEHGLPRLLSGLRGTQLRRQLAPALSKERPFAYAQNYSYLGEGLYAYWIKHWLKFFDRDRFLILQSEALFSDPRATMRRVHDFLGLEPVALGDATVHNTAETGYMPMPAETRRRLGAYYAEPNRELFELLGEEFSWSDSDGAGP